MATQTTLHEHYDSFADFAMQAAREPVHGRKRTENGIDGRHVAPSHIKKGAGAWGKFHSSETYEEAETWAAYGVPGIEERIEQIASRLTTSAGSHVLRHETFYDVSGAYPDVSRFLSGEPECMIDFAPDVSTGHRVATLVVNTSVSGCTHTEVIERRGAAILALASLLEQNGIRLEIIAGADIAADITIAISITIKHAQDAFDLTRTSYCLACPDFLRRHIFSYQEAHAQWDKLDCWPNQYGYGYVRDGALQAAFPQADIYLPSLNNDQNFHSDTSAEQWVIKTLQGFGIEVETE